MNMERAGSAAFEVGRERSDIVDLMGRATTLERTFGILDLLARSLNLAVETFSFGIVIDCVDLILCRVELFNLVAHSVFAPSLPLHILLAFLLVLDFLSLDFLDDGLLIETVETVDALRGLLLKDSSQLA